MADFYDYLSDKLIAFIAAQPMFFVATAAPGARVNLSPKGMDTFRVLDPARCAYLDITGSGNETAAHIKADGRITIMFNSFTQQPLIVRLYGSRVALSARLAEAVSVLPLACCVASGIGVAPPGDAAVCQARTDSA